nr:glycolipid transfer protein 1-like isoform X5 [Malus domestica]
MERIYQSNPSKFEYLYSLVNHDVKTNTLFKSTSVSLVWLTRYMDFLVELFRNLREHPLDWVIGGNGDVMGDMEKFCTSLLLYLNRITSFCLVAKVPSTYPKQRKMGKTMFAPALEELESVKSESKEIMTKHFLESCNKILPIIAEFGNVVYPVTFDIRTCVVRLQYRYSSEAMVMSQEF